MPFDDPAHRPALTDALAHALTDCGADQWAKAPAWMLARYLVAAYEAFVLNANDRARWQLAETRRPAPQG